MINGMNVTSMVQTIQAALSTYEGTQEQGTTTADTPIKRLEVQAVKVLATLQEVITLIETNQKRWVASGITELIAATADGEIVPGGTYDKARWLELQAAYTALSIWLLTPMSDGGPTPVMVIFRDYVAPPPPVVP